MKKGKKSYYLDNSKFEEVIIHFQYYKKQKFKYEFIIEDLKPSCIIRNSDYHKDILNLIEIKYKEANTQYTYYYEELVKFLYTLSGNVAGCKRSNLMELDDAIQEAIWICLEKIDKFDPSLGRAFNYMTTCIINHLKQNFRSRKNYNELKKKFLGFLQDTSDDKFFRKKVSFSDFEIENE